MFYTQEENQTRLFSPLFQMSPSALPIRRTKTRGNIPTREKFKLLLFRLLTVTENPPRLISKKFLRQCKIFPVQKFLLTRNAQDRQPESRWQLKFRETTWLI